jgi:hypothetical protein
MICLFDVSRSGNEGPVSWMPTIPSKRKQIVGGGIGMKGIVSAMAVNPSGDGILAAGTFTRHVGLYSSNGSGELLGTSVLRRPKRTVISGERASLNSNGALVVDISTLLSARAMEFWCMISA